MADSMMVKAGEHTAEELLELMQAGERLVVRAEVLGSTEELTLRFDGETYYCDTPTTLHKHDEEEEMRECLERYGFVRE